MRRWWKSSDICESQRSLEGIFAACYALGPLKVSWAPLHMFWDGCVFEVAVAAGISLTDWRLSRFWQLSHFSFTVIHHRITIRRARTHCRWGKKGSSGKGRRRLSSGRSTSGAETLVRSHPVRGGALRVFFFFNKLATWNYAEAYQTFEEAVLLEGPNTFWHRNIKALWALLRVTDITAGTLQLARDKCIRFAKSTRRFAVGQIMVLPILRKSMTKMEWNTNIHKVMAEFWSAASWGQMIFMFIPSYLR